MPGNIFSNMFAAFGAPPSAPPAPLWPTAPVRKMEVAALVGMPRSIALANRLQVLQGAMESQYGDIARRQALYSTFLMPSMGPRSPKTANLSKRFGVGVNAGIGRVMRIFGNPPGR